MLIAPVVVLPPFILAVAELIEPVVLATSNFAFDPAAVVPTVNTPLLSIRSDSAPAVLVPIISGIPAEPLLFAIVYELPSNV